MALNTSESEKDLEIHIGDVHQDVFKNLMTNKETLFFKRKQKTQNDFPLAKIYILKKSKGGIDSKDLVLMSRDHKTNNGNQDAH